jgi:hypothetical protein
MTKSSQRVIGSEEKSLVKMSDGVDAVVCLGPTEGRQGFFFGIADKTKSVGDTDTNSAIAGALLGAFLWSTTHV